MSASGRFALFAMGGPGGEEGESAGGGHEGAVRRRSRDGGRVPEDPRGRLRGRAASARCRPHRRGPATRPAPPPRSRAGGGKSAPPGPGGKDGGRPSPRRERGGVGE